MAATQIVVNHVYIPFAVEREDVRPSGGAPEMTPKTTC
jgi:hypothetical protein